MAEEIRNEESLQTIFYQEKRRVTKWRKRASISQKFLVKELVEIQSRNEENETNENYVREEIRREKNNGNGFHG